MKDLIIDGIELRPVSKFRIEIVDYYVSKCGKIWSEKTKKWKKPFRNWRGKTGEGKPKCYDFSMTTPGKPFWDAGMKYKSKRSTNVVEFRMKLHIAVKTAWNPLEDYTHEIGITKEIWDSTHPMIQNYMYETMLIDHIDDDITNNHLSNLQYSTPLKNSNYRKLW